jgi:hypothetical protein
MEVDLTTRTPAAANARAEAVRLNVQQAAVLYTKAVELKDWRTLKYTSVRAWASGEFGPDRFSAERRKEITSLLTKAGLTVRAIAAATGASTNTVIKDQQKLVSQSETQDSVSPTPRQAAAKAREAKKKEEVPETKPAATVAATRGSRGPTGKGGRISQEELNEAAVKALRAGKSQSKFALGLGIGDNSMMLAKAWTRAEMLAQAPSTELVVPVNTPHLDALFRQKIEEKFGPWVTATGNETAAAIVELMLEAYTMGRESTAAAASHTAGPRS